MKPQTVLLLVAGFFISIVMLIIANTYSFFQPTARATFISPGDIGGMAIEHDQKLYTLNYQQQNEALNLINRSVRVSKIVGDNLDPEKLSYNKIIIYPLEGKEIELTLLGTSGKQIVYSVPEWNSEGLLREVSPGQLKTLLDQTFDP